MAHLESRRIGTRLLFGGKPARASRRYKNIPHRVVGPLTNADRVTEQTFWVGLYPGLTRPMLEYIVNMIGEALHAKQSDVPLTPAA